MVNIYTAYTAPINPEGATPLSVDQVWKGLQRKVRFAQEFVPMIEECEVLEEKDEGRTVTRRMRFKDSEKWVNETCVEFEPTKVCEIHHSMTSVSSTGVALDVGSER
jgi:hypothetical protein